MFLYNHNNPIFTYIIKALFFRLALPCFIKIRIFLLKTIFVKYIYIYISVFIK